MTPLMPPLGPGELVAWRMDRAVHASSWDSGEGAFQAGGRWNSKRLLRIVYCSLDPATAILEVAVHNGFKILDTVPHVITWHQLDAAAVPDIYIVYPNLLPNPNWLIPGMPSIGQQQFGDNLLTQHDFVLLPSVVSRHSWNLLFDANKATGKYAIVGQEAFALDTRLHAAP